MIFTGASSDEVWPLVRDYHYSKQMPAGVRHRFAWREDGGLFGDTGMVMAGIVYGTGNIKMPFDALEMMRLVRDPSLTQPLSLFVSQSIRWLRANTGWAFIFSYADPSQEHHGGIYQASGFTYVGRSKRQKTFFNNDGEPIHKRTVSAELGTASQEGVFRKHPDWTVGYTIPKYLYIKPLRQRLNSILRQQGWKKLPYPKPDHAARLLDAPVPTGVSQEHTLGAAPNSNGTYDPRRHR